MDKTVYTIGHSTHPLETFLSMLQSFGITFLADIRRFPASRKYPHFNKLTLEESLHNAGIRYLHMPALGGRRQPRPDSKNTAWRSASFRGYADYMETPEFHDAIQQLQSLALSEKLAYMCSEAVWWRCHRALVSDFLKTHGWQVLHIMDTSKSTEHPYTSAARESQGKLFYD